MDIHSPFSFTKVESETCLVLFFFFDLVHFTLKKFPNWKKSEASNGRPVVWTGNFSLIVTEYKNFIFSKIDSTTISLRNNFQISPMPIIAL